MKTRLSVFQKKINVVFLGLFTVFFVASCSSDDDNAVDDQMMQEEETTLDFNLLVDSWEAQDFVFESSNSALPDTNVTGQGGMVDLVVSDSGAFTFTLMFVGPDATIMNSGEFRIENNTLQARFDPSGDFRNLQAELDQENLTLEGEGIFDLSGDGSNVPLRFSGTFFRK